MHRKKSLQGQEVPQNSRPGARVGLKEAGGGYYYSLYVSKVTEAKIAIQAGCSYYAAEFCSESLSKRHLELF